MTLLVYSRYQSYFLSMFTLLFLMLFLDDGVEFLSKSHLSSDLAYSFLVDKLCLHAKCPDKCVVAEFEIFLGSPLGHRNIVLSASSSNGCLSPPATFQR